MDPLTVTLLATGASTLVGLTAVWLRRWRSTRHAALPPPSAEHVSGEGSAHTVRTASLDEIIEEVTSHIVFSQAQVEVGREVVGQRVTGHVLEPVEYPADRVEQRPSRGPEDLPFLSPEQMALPPVLRTPLLLSGELPIDQHLEQRPTMEPVTEPIYRETARIVYVLLDVSPSMVERHLNGWSVPYWKGIVRRLIWRTFEARATFSLRFFGGTVTELLTGATVDDMYKLENRVMNAPVISSTDIAGAIRTAVDDLGSQQLDQAELMIVTDGESQTSLDGMRNVLEVEGIRLTSIMIGTQNDGLGRISDVYQAIPSPGRISPPFCRS